MIESIHLRLLLATFAGWVGRQQTAVIIYLIEENRVLKEQLESSGKRVRFRRPTPSIGGQREAVDVSPHESRAPRGGESLLCQ